MALGFVPGSGSSPDFRDPGPLQQRLLLYGFAWLQIDPFTANAVAALGLAGLQLRAFGHDAHLWQALFAGADPFSEHSCYPVICPSLGELKQIRSRQPDRPLIFVQTAYSAPPGPRALAALFGDRPPLARRLNPADPFRPLCYFRAVHHQQAPCLHPAWQQFPRHPLADFMAHAVAVDPHSKFWAQEDGLVLQQQSLFHPRCHLPDFFMGILPHYDTLFLDFMVQIPRGAYIFASDREVLDWFRADCVRLLDKRYTCWNWPQQNEAGDPSIPLILVEDVLINFRRLAQPLPLVHLDTCERAIGYRTLRARNPQPPTWRPDRQGDCIAHCLFQGRRLTFAHHEEGWFCADGQTTGPDGGQHFQHYLETLEALGV